MAVNGDRITLFFKMTDVSAKQSFMFAFLKGKLRKFEGKKLENVTRVKVVELQSDFDQN